MATTPDHMEAALVEEAKERPHVKTGDRCQTITWIVMGTLLVVGLLIPIVTGLITIKGCANASQQDASALGFCSIARLVYGISLLVIFGICFIASGTGSPCGAYCACYGR